jgi:hypothetical protein
MSRSKKLTKLLRRALKMEHLYTPEKLKEFKKELKKIENQIEESEKNNSKGFGK